MAASFRALAKLGDHVRHGRLDELVRILIDRIPPPLFHFDVVYIAELSDPVRSGQPPEDVSIRQIDRTALPELYASFPRKDRSEFGERFEAGHRCFAARIDGTICGMAWLDMGAVHDEPEKFCKFVIPPDAAWHYDVMILPEYRRRGLFSALMQQAFEYVCREGRTRVCGFTSRYNQGSVKAHTRIGFRLTKKITALNLLGLRLHRIRQLDRDRVSRTRIGFMTAPGIDLDSASFQSPP